MNAQFVARVGQRITNEYYRGCYTRDTLHDALQFYNPNALNVFYVQINTNNWITLIMDSNKCILIDPLATRSYFDELLGFIDEMRGDQPLQSLPMQLQRAGGATIPFVLFFSHYLLTKSINQIFHKFDFKSNAYIHNEKIVKQWLSSIIK